jgi:Na+/melibiose symporter-like transporter
MIGTQQALAPRTVATYAIGSLGTGGFSTLPGLVLIYYLTDTLGVAALAAGMLVGVAKARDVLIDPQIGFASDRQLARRGSRRGLMLLGGILLPVFFVLTFATPAALPRALAAGWVCVAFIAAATAFSLFQVPYIALPAELTARYDQRTRLLTWRVVVLSFAILLFGAGGAALRRLGGGDPYLGYLIMGAIAGGAIGIGLVVSSFVAPADVRATHAPPPRFPLAAHYRAGMRAMRDSRPFRVLVLAYLLQGMATGDMLAGANYVATWVLHDPHAVPFLFVALIGPALLAAPLWGVVAQHIGKERGFALASIAFGSGAWAMLALIWAPGRWIYAAVALCGAGYAGMQSLPMAMLPDVISHDARRHGPGRAGTFGGMWTAAETAGFALGATVLSIVLAATGYVAHAGTGDVVQSSRSIVGIVLSFSVVPGVLVMLSLVPLARYRLRREDIDGP